MTSEERPAHLGGYRPDEQLHDPTAEFDRLDAQVELSWSEELRLLRLAGLTDGMTIVELGAGSGRFARRLLDELPHSTVVAIEADDRIADRARRRNADLAARYQVRCERAEETSLADHSHDFAIARLLLQHVPEPLAVTREARRFLRPGAHLAVIDVDIELWGLVEPCMPASEVIYRKAAQVNSSWGGNRTIGRRLSRILTQTGLEAVGFDLFVSCSGRSDHDLLEAQINPVQLFPALSAGFISMAEYAEARLEYEQFCGLDDKFVMLVGFFAHGHTPE